MDAVPGRGDLDEHSLLLDANAVIGNDEVLGLDLGDLLVKEEAGVDLNADASRDDGVDLLAEFEELSR